MEFTKLTDKISANSVGLKEMQKGVDAKGLKSFLNTMAILVSIITLAALPIAASFSISIVFLGGLSSGLLRYFAIKEKNKLKQINTAMGEQLRKDIDQVLQWLPSEETYIKEKVSNIAKLMKINTLLINVFEQKLLHLNKETYGSINGYGYINEVLKKLELRKETITQMQRASTNGRYNLSFIKDEKYREAAYQPKNADFFEYQQHVINNNEELEYIKNYGVEHKDLKSYNLLSNGTEQGLGFQETIKPVTTQKVKVNLQEIIEPPAVFKDLLKAIEKFEEAYLKGLTPEEKVNFESIKLTVSELMDTYSKSKLFKNKQEFESIIKNIINSIEVELNDMGVAIEKKLLKDMKTIDKYQNSRKIALGK